MCGIAGILDGYSQIKKENLKKMCAVMRHRGPDGEGIHIEGPIGLGHCRLSIIDLEGGKQPMSNEDGTVWITFNGEIYNFQNLQVDLRAKGHNFRTRSDTETIVHAYEEFGENCLNYFRGMFAFGIWDSNKKRLFLARDRIGKKPLYYYFESKRFIFASEIKAIIQHELVSKEMDTTALSAYLAYLYIPSPKTIFKKVKKLPPGNYMIVEMDSNIAMVSANRAVDKPVESRVLVPSSSLQQNTITNALASQSKLTLTVRRYWDLHFNPNHSIKEEEWIEGLRDKLWEAVKVRLISDVPLGAFLSGGVDSSSIVALMSQMMNQPVKTFCIGFEEEDFSEISYARVVAKKFNTDHKEMIVKPDAIELLPRLAWEFDEPFGDSSAIPTYYVSKMAREHVTVVLSGDGGDETFAGYNRYTSAFLYHNKIDIIPGFLRRLIFGGASSILPQGMRGKGFLRHLSATPFDRYRGMITQDEPGYLRSILSEDVWRELGKEEDNNMYFLQYYDKYPSNDYLTKIQYLDTMTYLPEDILVKVDRASMLNSLETRAPLLDHEILEYLAKIPFQLKIKNGEKKYLLKKAMEGILPQETLYRKKMGFGVPLVYWFKKDLSKYTRELLLSKESLKRNIFNKDYIESILQTHQHKGRDVSAKIWSLIFFENWCRIWLDGNSSI